MDAPLVGQDGCGSMCAMRLRMPGIYDRTMKLLPPAVSANIDLRRPKLWASWGGSLNGQDKRRAIVREIAALLPIDFVVETGTYRGSSTEFFAAVFDAPIETVEASRRFYTFSKVRLAPLRQVKLTLGDSRTLLRNLTPRLAASTSFIYLDAHWELDLPLREELQIIESATTRAVVMVDDFAVPGDHGYKYDDYGQGLALVEAYLPDLDQWRILYPSAPSSEETGARRGCVVLVSPELADTPFTTVVARC